MLSLVQIARNLKRTTRFPRNQDEMIRPHSIRILLFLAIVLCWAAPARSQSAGAAVVPRPDDASKVRLETFEKVWNTINEKHYDPTFNGVDWAAVREQYLPKARAARSDEDFHNVLRQMLSELKQSHFNIFPPPPVIADGSGDGNGTVGIEIVWLDDKPVVGRVEKGSAADKAGIRPGFILTTIDGRAVTDALKPLRESLAKRKTTEMMRRVYLERTTEAVISGKPNSSIRVGLLDGEDRPRQSVLTREPFTGEMSKPLGNFPKQRVIFESRLLPGNVGYIRFNMWVVPQAAKIRAAVREFAGSDGIIFDLRGNPGGIGGLAGGVAGLISEKQISLGSMTSRAGVMNLIGYPQPEPFLGRIVVLTDHGSASTSEMFAAGIKETGRGKVIGGRTAGAILLSVFDPLPTGYIFQYAISDYRSPNNVLIEGRGVEPDIKVELTRGSLLEGRDVQLETALNEITKEN